MTSPNPHCLHDYRHQGTRRAGNALIEQWCCAKCTMPLRVRITNGRAEHTELMPGCVHDYKQTSAFYQERTNATHTASTCRACGSRKLVEKLCGMDERRAA